MKKILVALFIFFALGCSKRNNIIIKGTLSSTEGEPIYLNHLGISGEETIDSVRLRKSGDFTFKVKYKDPQFLILRLSSDNFITLQALPDEKIALTGDAKNLAGTYKVSGSEGSRKVKELNDHLSITKIKLDSLTVLYRKYANVPGTDEILEKLNHEYFATVESQRRYSIGFVLKNLTSFASITALYQRLDTSLFVFYKTMDMQYFKLVSDSLKNLYPRSPYVKSLLAHVQNFNENFARMKLNKLAENVPPMGFIDISLPNVNGDTVKLSSLKGKYVLLSFWASWNSYSVQENLELMKVYDKYKQKGFEIYQVSLDNRKEAWLREVKFSNLPWINVSELTYPNSQVASLYNVYRLPANYLISPGGDIIGKNLSINQLTGKLDNKR